MPACASAASPTATRSPSAARGSGSGRPGAGVMPEPLLTILKFCFLAIVYLFFVRVLRAVWAEVRGPAAVAAPAPAARPARPAFGGHRPPGRLKVLEPTERRGR